MTSKELNAAVKKLQKKHTELPEDEVKKEIGRLYHDDYSLKSLNADSLRILLRLNLRYRAITLHFFGIGIEI